jgi:hypothetical protein
MTHLLLALAISLLPHTPLIEHGKTNQLLNFDFVLQNPTNEKAEIVEVEVDVLGANDTLIAQRRVGENGLSVTTIPNRFIEPNGKLVVFNPIYSFEPDLDLSHLRYTFRFEGGAKQTIDVHPKPYETTTNLVMPLSGRVLVHDGHDFYSHHRRLDITGAMTTALHIEANATRYAYDFVIVDEQGKMYRNDGEKNEEWYGFGAPLYAPGSGVVVESLDGIDDNTKSNLFKPVMEEILKDLSRIFGNHVIVDHGNGEFSLLAHMKKGSVLVKKGDRVKQGQQLGQLGFSGDAFLAHLHYELQSDAHFGEGLPSYFHDYKRLTGGKSVSVKQGQVDSGDVLLVQPRP